MSETTCFVALPFDFFDGGYVAGQPTEGASPAAFGKYSVMPVQSRSAVPAILRQENLTTSTFSGDLGKLGNSKNLRQFLMHRFALTRAYSRGNCYERRC
jgi:hypothetical protein